MTELELSSHAGATRRWAEHSEMHTRTGSLMLAFTIAWLTNNYCLLTGP